jgi:hypothetical protein
MHRVVRAASIVILLAAVVFGGVFGVFLACAGTAPPNPKHDTKNIWFFDYGKQKDLSPGGEGPTSNRP